VCVCFLVLKTVLGRVHGRCYHESIWVRVIQSYEFGGARCMLKACANMLKHITTDKIQAKFKILTVVAGHSAIIHFRKQQKT